MIGVTKRVCPHWLQTLNKRKERRNAPPARGVPIKSDGKIGGSWMKRTSVNRQVTLNEIKKGSCWYSKNKNFQKHAGDGWGVPGVIGGNKKLDVLVLI